MALIFDFTDNEARNSLYLNVNTVVVETHSVGGSGVQFKISLSHAVLLTSILDLLEKVIGRSITHH